MQLSIWPDLVPLDRPSSGGPDDEAALVSVTYFYYIYVIFSISVDKEIMGDSWEDWDDDAADIPAPAVPVAAIAEDNKFADEDAEEDAPKWAGTVPEMQAVRYRLNCLQPWVAG